MHHLVGALPHRVLGSLAKKLGPIFHLKLGEISVIVISSPLLAKEIMKTHDISFANRPKLLSIEIVAYNYIDIAFSPYGGYWRQVRKICNSELLSVKKVQSFRSVREEESWNLVHSIAMHGSKAINITDKIFTLMNGVACRVAIGSRCKDPTKLVGLLGEVISLSSGFDISDIFPSIKILHLVTGTGKKLMKLRKKLDCVLDDIIVDHQQHCVSGRINHNEDLLDVLLRLKDDGGLQFPLGWDNIKAIILDVFAAWTNTYAVTLDWAMSELMKNPRVMTKAQAELRHALKGKTKIHESDIQELDYLKLVIKETLRLHPSLPLLLPRECREKCEIGGYHIPIATKVIINVWKVGRDPDYWIDPETFMPERFCENSIKMAGANFEYLPFGSGRRMCPGMSLGLANVELPLVMLLYHFDRELPSYKDVDMSEACGVNVKRKNKLHLIPIAYAVDD